MSVPDRRLLRLQIRTEDLRRAALRWAKRDIEGWCGGDDKEVMTENLFEAARRYRNEVLGSEFCGPTVTAFEEKKA